MAYKLVIFDFDGTIADSLPWLSTVAGEAADRYGFRDPAEFALDDLRQLHAEEILDRLQVPRWKIPAIARHIRARKSADSHLIPLFPGVDGVLDSLVAQGVALAIVSSDREDNIRRILGERRAAMFGVFACGASLFGKAAKFRAVMRRVGVRGGLTLCIGDELRDADAARRAGADFGAVTWGYTAADALLRADPDLVFEAFSDIPASLASASLRGLG